MPCYLAGMEVFKEAVAIATAVIAAFTIFTVVLIACCLPFVLAYMVLSRMVG